MKNIIDMKRTTLISLLILTSLSLFAQASFRFALLTDIHVSRSNPSPLQDLSRSVADINLQDDVAFVVVSGDVTEAGDLASMLAVRSRLDSLRVPYYITSGNHETNWSESGCLDFDRVFGDRPQQQMGSRFVFTYQGVTFVGFNSGPVLKMADGHVAPQDMRWVRQQLDTIPLQQPVIAITHYPLQAGDVDNWYDATDMLNDYNTQIVIGGHYHRNLVFTADNLPNVLCRSNLRGKDSINGYTLIDVDPSEITFREKRINQESVWWTTLPFRTSWAEADRQPRPTYEVNQLYPQVQEVWRTGITAGVYGTPCLHKSQVYVGDDEGWMYALDAKTGKLVWRVATGSRIFSSPAAENGCLVFGNTAGDIYCLNEKDGATRWKVHTEKAVLGSPAFAKIGKQDVVLIGGSDNCMRALSVKDGREIWCFSGMNGYHATRPCVYNNKVYFGAWDCYMYALNLSDGSLAWKWSNGKTNDKFSPAACWPVAANGRLYFAAPDRYWTCLNAETGEVIWRTNEHMVREAVGLSTDGKMVFSHCMYDSVVAVSALDPQPTRIWKTNAAYGYDHDPSMMVERDGVVIFGTRNGLLFGLNAQTGDILWSHKLGNSLIHTICPINGRECIVSSTDGSVTRLKIK